jgi:diguanylate cyclase (GGDEF)-like protein
VRTADEQMVRHARDEHDLELRLRTLQTGIWPTLVGCACTTVYLLATLDRPHRSLLLILDAAAVLSALAVLFLPVDGIVRRWPEPFFLTWTASFVSVITAACLADGGTTSPLAASFFLPIAFASLSYPTRSLLAVGGMNLVAYGLVMVLGPRHDLADAWLFATTLTVATWICAWQTRNHDRARAVLADVSRTDDLTGALNRRGFEERMLAALAVAQRSGGEVGFVLLDLDDFKAVNDTRGHQAGDELLGRVAQLLHDRLRDGDIVGRLGGDEFAVLLPDGNTRGALARIHEHLDAIAPASAGVAVYPEDGVTYAELYRVADARLYDGKRAGTVPDTLPPPISGALEA